MKISTKRLTDRLEISTRLSQTYLSRIRFLIITCKSIFLVTLKFKFFRQKLLFSGDQPFLSKNENSPFLTIDIYCYNNFFSFLEFLMVRKIYMLHYFGEFSQKMQKRTKTIQYFIHLLFRSSNCKYCTYCLPIFKKI